MRIKKNKTIIFILMITMLLGQYINSLIPQLGAFITIVYCVIHHKNITYTIKNKYYPLCMILLFFIFTIGIINSYIKYGESILDSLRKLIVPFSMILFYFTGTQLIYSGKITIQDIKDILTGIAIIALILYIIQYFIYDNVLVLSVNVGERDGRIRLYYQCLAITPLLYFSFDNLLKRKNTQKIKSFFLIMVIIVEIFYIQQYRTTTLGILISLGVGYFLSKKSYKKLLVFVVLILTVRVIFSYSNTLQLMFESYINGTGTFRVRSLAVPYYLSKLKGHFLFGNGIVFPSEPFTLAALAAGYGNRIYLNDNGIIGFFYMFGLMGLIWFTCFWLKMLFDGYILAKKNNTFYGVLFPLYLLLTMRTELHWYWNNGMVVLVIFLILLESEKNLCKNL